MKLFVAFHDGLTDMSCLSCIIITFHDIHNSQCCCTGYRVSTEGSSDSSCRCRIHDLGSCCDRGDRKSCAKGFRSCDDIRCCACFCPVLRCIIFTCSAVTTLNLICDHQDSVVIADLADCFNPLDRCRDKSTFALKRLNDHAGDLTCRCALVKDSLKLINVILNCLFLCISFWCTVYIWIWCTKDSCRERSHAYCIGFFCCQCHGQVCSSVESACEADHTASFCECFCDLDRVLIALCTGVCEVCFFHISFARHDLI